MVIFCILCRQWEKLANCCDDFILGRKTVYDMDDLNLQNHVDYPDILVVIGYLMTFSLAGSVGNAFVIYIFSRKREKSTTTVFILVLAMTDFFTCLVIIPFTIYYEVMEKRVNSNVQCKIYMFLITTNIPFSAFIMVLIAFDRYFKICRPWNQCLNIRMSKKIVIAVLLFALSLGIIPSLTHRVYPISDETSTIENNITSHVFDGDKQSADNGTVMEPNNTAYQSLIPKLDFPRNVSSNSSDNRKKYEGYCMPVLEYFSQSFMKTYQNICFWSPVYLSPCCTPWSSSLSHWGGTRRVSAPTRGWTGEPVQPSRTRAPRAWRPRNLLILTKTGGRPPTTITSQRASDRSGTSYDWPTSRPQGYCSLLPLFSSWLFCRPG